MTRLGAHDVIALLADPASWHSWDRPPTQVTADSKYAEDLAAQGQDRARRSGDHRSRDHPRPPHRNAGVRLRFSRRLDRNRGKRPSGRGHSAGHR